MSEIFPSYQQTPKEMFFVPILRALQEMGGSGRTSEVLARMEEAMQDILNAADYDTTPETRRTCWKINARWARNQMVEDGLMKPSHQYGLWEISEQGRAFLEQHQEPEA